MHAHWFVVASQKTVNIYTETQSRSKLQLLRTFDNPVPEEASALAFAKELANYLDKEYQYKNFQTLSIAAEPHFIGKIREVLKPQISKLVQHWIKKDLQKIPMYQLPVHLPLNLSRPDSEASRGL